MKLRDEVEIGATAQQVWRSLIDLDRAPEFVPYLRHIEHLDDAGVVESSPAASGATPLGIGSRIRLVLGVTDTQSVSVEAKVVGLDPPLRLRVSGEHEGHGVEAVIEWRLEEKAPAPSLSRPSTILRQNVDLGFRSMLMRIGAKAMLGRAERELAVGLQRFKEIVEHDAAEADEAVTR
jgi:carbon monoxide dehydrogenase subunit G